MTNTTPQTTIYKGDDVHAYTTQAQQVVKNISKTLSEPISHHDFNKILQEFETKYGIKPAYSNFTTVFRDGYIIDHELPGLNSAAMLKVLWDNIKNFNDASLYKHFEETLDQISLTCIQGITHRLLVDYVAIVGPNGVHSLLDVGSINE
jgi:hypothetical protein